MNSRPLLLAFLVLLVGCGRNDAPTKQAAFAHTPEIDRYLDCSALLLLTSKGLESSGYPNTIEIADMQKMSVSYLKRAEALAGAPLQDELIAVTTAEQERERNKIKADGYDALLQQLQERKNVCGYVVQ